MKHHQLPLSIMLFCRTEVRQVPKNCLWLITRRWAIFENVDIYPKKSCPRTSRENKLTPQISAVPHQVNEDLKNTQPSNKKIFSQVIAVVSQLPLELSERPAPLLHCSAPYTSWVIHSSTILDNGTTNYIVTLKELLLQNITLEGNANDRVSLIGRRLQRVWHACQGVLVPDTNNKLLVEFWNEGLPLVLPQGQKTQSAKQKLIHSNRDFLLNAVDFDDMAKVTPKHVQKANHFEWAFSGHWTKTIRISRQYSFR